MCSDKIRWGILGTGRIAQSFAEGLKSAPQAELTAVGSRRPETARQFASTYNVKRAFGSYQELAQDGSVDVVYVATPHVFHYENCLLCLQNNKAVLCEKPFTINAAEAAQLIDLARRKHLFLMEAMWTRFLPVIVKLREILQEGLIGGLHNLSADLGFKPEFDPEHRLFNLNLGGGALLDLGVYPISLASMLFGKPQQICSSALIGKTGVDEQANILFDYSAGKMANLFTSIRANTPGEALITAENGRIRLHGPLFRPAGITLSQIGEKDEIIEAKLTGNGFNYEAAEVMRCLTQAVTESRIMPLSESLEIMQTMDELRRQWGLKYPSETGKSDG